MTTINQESWNNRDGYFENSETKVADSRLAHGEYNMDTDEDDQNLHDDWNGRELDIDSRDEWDAGNVSNKDLDNDDLEDNDEAIADLHSAKNAPFGSITAASENTPDPDEIPEEHEVGNEEFDYPDGGDVEEANNDEVEYDEPAEVTPPAPEPDTKAATLNNLDPTFVDDTHQRQTKRIVDHEPGAGSTTGEHGAYNL